MLEMAQGGGQLDNNALSLLRCMELVAASFPLAVLTESGRHGITCDAEIVVALAVKWMGATARSTTAKVVAATVEATEQTAQWSTGKVATGEQEAMPPVISDGVWQSLIIRTNNDIFDHLKRFLPGSRSWLFDQYKQWLALPQENANHRAFVLYGGAGVGKSTWAARLVQMRKETGVMAYHFCKHSDTEWVGASPTGFGLGGAWEGVHVMRATGINK